MAGITDRQSILDRSSSMAILFAVLSTVVVPGCTSQKSASKTENQQTASKENATSDSLSRPPKTREGGSKQTQSAMTSNVGGRSFRLNLPEKHYQYASLKLPEHVNRTQVDELDNTPPENPLTDGGATLGRVLFYDKQLSRDNSVACASCHRQEIGFADSRTLSVGIKETQTKRNTMNLANLRFTNLRGLAPGLFWDERSPTLEDQVLIPIQDPTEMDMQLSDLTTKLAKLNYYSPLFEAAFGSTEITPQRISRALAQFLRSMVSLNSRFDRAADRHGGNNYAEDFAEFTDQENLGKSLFINGVGGIAEIGCAHCHIPPTFAMPKAFNNGLDRSYKDKGLGELKRVSNDPFTPSNDGKFKAPSLRNIALTAPYMHDGRFATLEEVVAHYSDGIHPHENLGLAIAGEESLKQGETSGFKMSARQQAALVSFLKTLTDDEFIRDPRFSNPFEQVETTTAVGQSANSDLAAKQFDQLTEEFEEQGGAKSFAKRFLNLAEQHPNTPAAFDALVWVVKNVRARSETTRAIEALTKNHIENKKLNHTYAVIIKARSIAAEGFLRAAMENGHNLVARAQACLHLSILVNSEANAVAELKEQPELAERVVQYYGKEYGSYLASLDPKQITEKQESVYQQMIESFKDVPHEDGTLGELAATALYKIRNLSIGKPAPEIEGEDIFGEEFKLSEFRGKIVMLSFWGHW